MMQVPLSSYPHFSQFLQLQHLHQQRFSRTYASHASDLGMLSVSRTSGGTSCSEASTETPSSSPSPPLSLTENFSANGQQNPGRSSVKSFTIDAILGIRDRDIEKIDGDHLNVMPNNFRSRLGLGLANSHVEKYPNSLDLSNATLEIGVRNDVASRFSATSRDLLTFQLPTDLTTSNEVAGNEMNRRNLQNQISTYQNSRACGGSNEKSPGEISKKCGGKSKRVRTIFTPEQLERLEAEFERQQYMVGPERLYLAHTLQLTEAQVKVWFQNRRIKWRKQHLEIQQQRLAAIKQQSQRGDAEESDGEESGDSNQFPFSGDSTTGETVPTPANFFKATEPESEVNSNPFLINKMSSPTTLRSGENSNENESNNENV